MTGNKNENPNADDESNLEKANKKLKENTPLTEAEDDALINFVDRAVTCYSFYKLTMTGGQGGRRTEKATYRRTWKKSWTRADCPQKILDLRKVQDCG